ncbi:E2 [Leptonychotes weddellii papillomavirus 5]|uniref:Regulatory protein E2 n=1 Tax=Leptonychotes weddellii papillomavirus 5 TaxID=2077306 RepID=A0A2I8B2Q8_9PAPI|nr:E2 [Leptonychotes weddellii papillomavirus 5]AUT11920.1 E2 [Leptonychotes weddellii papillomavirus 5]
MMEALNERFAALQEVQMAHIEQGSTKLSDQRKYWELCRREHVLLNFARRHHITRLGMNIVPGLATSEAKAKDAIRMGLLLQALLDSPYADEPWSMSDTSFEVLLAPPEQCFKKNGVTVEVSFDNDPLNCNIYTLWKCIYYMDEEDKWKKTEGKVDYDGLYYEQEDGLRVYYHRFLEDAQFYGSTLQWTVNYKNKRISASVSSSALSSGPLSPALSEIDGTEPPAQWGRTLTLIIQRRLPLHLLPMPQGPWGTRGEGGGAGGPINGRDPDPRNNARHPLVGDDSDEDEEDGPHRRSHPKHPRGEGGAGKSAPVNPTASVPPRPTGDGLGGRDPKGVPLEEGPLGRSGRATVLFRAVGPRGPGREGSGGTSGEDDKENEFPEDGEETGPSPESEEDSLGSEEETSEGSPPPRISPAVPYAQVAQRCGESEGHDQCGSGQSPPETGEPVILFKGDGNGLKCWRRRLKTRHRCCFSIITTTFSYAGDEGADRVGRPRMMIGFASSVQRETFLSKVKIPKGIDWSFGWFDAL